jgi:hypothetical protein
MKHIGTNNVRFTRNQARIVNLYKNLRSKLRRRWKDNIKIDLQEVGGGRGDWMELAQDRDR